MDASIMDGSDLNAGGVACIHNVANPIKVARLVMEKVTITMCMQLPSKLTIAFINCHELSLHEYNCKLAM